VLRVGPAVVDLAGREVRRAGQVHALSPQEAALLGRLAEAYGEPVERAVLLEDCLGYRPGVETRALDHAVTRLRRKLGGAEWLPSVYGVGYRLLVESHDLVGRDEVIEGLRGLRGIAQIVGPGGVGKTSVARAAGAEVFVDLRSVFTAEDLAGALERQVETHHDRIVLDNFEQLRGVGEELVLGLAQPGRQILVTTRHRLELPGEVVVLHPLGDDDTLRLFQQRAGEDLAPGPRLRSLMAGLPLAIELCAARLRVADLEELEERADQALGAGGVRWSLELLSEVDRAALGCCCAFAPSFTLAAWEAVYRGDDALERVQALVDLSLLRRAGGRFHLLQPIRLAAQLSMPPEAPARHAAFFSALAGRHAPTAWLSGEWAPLIEERDNLERALASAPDPSLVAGFDEVLGATAAVSHRVEVLERYDAEAWRRVRALRLAGRTDEAIALGLRAEPIGPLLLNLGGAYLQAGRLDEAEQTLLNAAASAREEGDAARAVFADFNRATVFALRGGLDQAIRLGRACLVELDALGAVGMRLPVLSSLASFALAAEDPEAARGYLERAAGCPPSPNRHHRLHLVYALAHVDLGAGRFEAALRGFRQVRDEAEGDSLVADALEGEAAVLAEERDYSAARPLLEEALVAHRRARRAADEERAAIRAALVDALRGRPPAALEELREAGEEAAAVQAFLAGAESPWPLDGSYPPGHEARLAQRFFRQP